MEYKLRGVRRLDSIKLDEKDPTYFTSEGYLVDHPILTSCGIFEYITDGNVRRELRLPEHVFSPDSLKTYKGKPIIITHEAGVVDKDNVDKEQIGTILSEGYQDGDDVRAEIIIHNTAAMKDCGLRELSLGYNLDLIEEPGVWNGEPYDAIQTNIVINHLALVANARAGEQARLNIDGSDEPELKGGRKMSKDPKNRNDGDGLTPEELEQAIAMFKANAAETPAKDDAILTVEGGTDPNAADTAEPAPSDETAKDTPEENGVEKILSTVKERRDRRCADGSPEDVEGCKGVIAQQDADLDTLLACLEKLLSDANCGAFDADADENKEKEAAPEEEVKEDSSEDESKSLNADSADEIFRQRLSICRVGDKLHMDGLENKSISEGKKAIIAKVLPAIRLDGRSRAYIDACYDLAVAEVSKRKDVAYQKQQMTQNQAVSRADSANESNTMASASRQRMIEREGGNK